MAAEPKKKDTILRWCLSFWCSEAIQIRTSIFTVRGGLYIIKCDRLCTILKIEGQ